MTRRPRQALSSPPICPPPPPRAPTSQPLWISSWLMSARMPRVSGPTIWNTVLSCGGSPGGAGGGQGEQGGGREEGRLPGGPPGERGRPEQGKRGRRWGALVDQRQAAPPAGAASTRSIRRMAASFASLVTRPQGPSGSRMCSSLMNHPPSLLMRAHWMDRLSSVRHWTTCVWRGEVGWVVAFAGAGGVGAGRRRGSGGGGGTARPRPSPVGARCLRRGPRRGCPAGWRCRPSAACSRGRTRCL
jgi:hypothetical protein